MSCDICALETAGRRKRFLPVNLISIMVDRKSTLDWVHVALQSPRCFIQTIIIKIILNIVFWFLI